MEEKSFGSRDTLRLGSGPGEEGLTFGDWETLRDEGVLLAGRYKVARRLGEGGMGSVWLAEDSKLDNRKVAVKMLPAILVGKKGAYRQVKAEAMVAMKLSHPNIATVRAFEEDEGGNPFLVMDYIEGEGLDDILAERGPLGEEETLRLLGPVAAALDYAHSQGVVHRDVKPGNVMVRKDGTPFVLDFGIAREVQETMTRVTGKLSSGTLLYMSPEQLRGKGPKAAQDVYSFAAMAYECLAGHPPFFRGAIEDQIKNEPPDPLPGSVGDGLRKGVMAGLSKEAAGRPRSCAGVLGGKGVRSQELEVRGKQRRAEEEEREEEERRKREAEERRKREEEMAWARERAQAAFEMRKREEMLATERRARAAAEAEARAAQRAAQQRTREAMEAEAARGRAVGWSVFLAIAILVVVGAYVWWQGKTEGQTREVNRLQQQVADAKAAKPTVSMPTSAAKPTAKAVPAKAAHERTEEGKHTTDSSHTLSVGPASKKTISDKDIERLLKAGARLSRHTSPPTDTSALSLAAWCNKAQPILYAAWKQPRELANLPELTCIASITVNAEGTITAFGLSKTSGNVLMDKSVREALQRVSSLPSLPAGVPAPQTISVTFVLD